MSPSDTATITQSKNEINNAHSKRAMSLAAWIAIALALLLWLLGWAFHVGGAWIHLLPVLVLFGLLAGLIPSKNIETEERIMPKWDPARPDESLAEIHTYVIREAGNSIRWYWRAKGSKALPSQIIRFSAWIFASAGGLLPVVGNIFKDYLPRNFDLSDGLWASLLLGIAAAFIGLDKAFGYSSGWARYVLTATSIRKALEEFRIEWAELMVKAGSSPKAEDILPLIERARKFRGDIEAMVLQETKDWVTEFQSNMAQMEKDIAAQLTAMKAQIDKAAQARGAASQPGSVQLSIQNAAKADAGAAISVILTDSKNQAIQETATGAAWAKLNLTPGQYKIRIQTTVSGKPAADEKALNVKPGEITPVQLTL